jgi:hypothetical protein
VSREKIFFEDLHIILNWYFNFFRFEAWATRSLPVPESWRTAAGSKSGFYKDLKNIANFDQKIK